MKRIILLIAILASAVLACKATDQTVVPQQDGSTIHYAQAQASAEPEPQLEEVCHVRTNVDAGTLNLRSCADISCSIIGYLEEGESLVILERGEWTKVETVTGTAGYVNSKFISCEGE